MTFCSKDKNRESLVCFAVKGLQTVVFHQKVNDISTFDVCEVQIETLFLGCLFGTMMFAEVSLSPFSFESPGSSVADMVAPDSRPSGGGNLSNVKGFLSHIAFYYHPTIALI